MSYYPKSPSNVSFAYTILGVKAPTLSGSDNICSSGSTFTLNNLPTGATVSWSVSSNLQILSSSNTGITVKASTTSAQGAGYINYTMNSNYGQVSETKNVYIGKPEFRALLNSSAPSTEAWAEISGQFTNLIDQGVSQIPTYTVISSSGFSSLYILNYNDGTYRVRGVGSTNYWNKTIDLSLVNSCGVTIKRIYLTPPPPSGGCDYTLQSTAVNTYSLLPPPDCLSSFQTMNFMETSMIGTSESATLNIYSIIVYDLNGVVVLETDEQSISLESLDKGFYIIKAIWNGNETTKKVAKSKF